MKQHIQSRQYIIPHTHARTHTHTHIHSLFFYSQAGRQKRVDMAGRQTIPEVSTGLRGASGDAGLATITLQHEQGVMHNIAVQ